MRKGFVIGGVILLMHAALQFVAWAYAARSGIFGSLWSALSFPTFTFIAASTATNLFWALFAANSIVWAVALTLVVLRRRQGRPSGGSKR